MDLTIHLRISNLCNGEVHAMFRVKTFQIKLKGARGIFADVFA